MIDLVAAVVTLLAGMAAGLGLARWRPHWAVQGLVALASALAVFWIGGQLGAMGAFESFEAMWQSINPDTAPPLEVVAAAPLAASFGFVSVMVGVARGMVWAMAGAGLWLLGLLLGGLLGARREAA